MALAIGPELLQRCGIRVEEQVTHARRKDSHCVRI